MGGGRRGKESEGERERDRARERERTSGLSAVSQSVRGFFSSLCVCACVPLILFHVMGLVPRRRNGTEKNIIINNWSNETNICNTDDLIQ